MKKILLAPFLAALAMFVWGFIYYGVTGIPYEALQPSQDAGPALNELFPESGVYIVPDPRIEADEQTAKLAEGPFATVHIVKEGMPAMDPMVMMKGFALEFVSCLLMVVVLTLARIGNYPGRLAFVVLIGLLMAVFTHGGQAVWWHQDWNWQIRTMVHDVVGWLAAGAILAAFVRSED